MSNDENNQSNEGNSRLSEYFNTENKDRKPDEERGEVAMALNIIHGKIVIAFERPAKSVAFNRQQAIVLANLLMSAACNIK